MQVWRKERKSWNFRKEQILERKTSCGKERRQAGRTKIHPACLAKLIFATFPDSQLFGCSEVGAGADVGTEGRPGSWLGPALTSAGRERSEGIVKMRERKDSRRKIG